jgi:hypothetical protein
MLDNAVIDDHLHAGASKADALAAGLGASSLLLAILSACGVGLIALLRRFRPREPTAADRAVAAAAAFHTVAVPGAAESQTS